MANPFEIDTSSFYKPTPSNASKKSAKNNDEEDFNYYQQQIDEIMEKTLESSNRGVNLLQESEEIGIATAQDLVAQGEKLQKVESQLDHINTTTKQSQKHINNINSVFGGFFKNMFSKSSKSPPEETKGQSSSSSSVPNKLSNTVDRINKQSDSYYYGDSGQMKKIDSTLSEPSRAALAGTKWEVMNDKVDENLDAMHANIARIRQLGLALGGELDSQNSALDRISGKAEKTDVEIRHQDQQMKKILGYGKNKDKQNPQSDQSSSSSVVEKSPPFIFKKK